MLAVCATLAVLAATSNATASVLQRKAARHTDNEAGMGIAVLWQLAHQKAWIAGIAALLLGFALQAAALATGPITLVQPLLVLELAVALLLSGLVFGGNLGRRVWASILGMSAGLALLLVGLRPVAGDPGGASTLTWVLGCVANLGLVAALTVAGHRVWGARRAELLGVAAGAGFGFTAALVSGVTAAFPLGVSGVLGTWQTWAMVLMGPAGFFMLQNALRAGKLVASQPGLSLANPLVSIGWGVAVFGEQVRAGPWLVAEIAGAALVAFCTIQLARSPLLTDDRAQDDSAQADSPPTGQEDSSPTGSAGG